MSKSQSQFWLRRAARPRAHNEMYVKCNAVLCDGKFSSASDAAQSLTIIFQLSSAAVCHNPQHPADSPADSSGAPLGGIRWIVSTAMCANWTGARPFVTYTFSNKNWQRNVISIQGAAEALSPEKINCYPLRDVVWQFLNRLDNGFIISPWNSHIEISDKQCNRKSAPSTDNRRVGREESMESRLKQREHNLTRHQFPACWQVSEVKTIRFQSSQRQKTH